MPLSIIFLLRETRETLKRIRNTFQVFFGYDSSSSPSEKCYSEEKLGLLDYIFPFPILFKKICSINPILWIFLGIPYFVLLVVEFIAAVALTLLVSPVVLLVHLCTKPMSDEYEEDVMKLKVIPCEISEKYEIETTMENLLQETPEVFVSINEGLDEIIENALFPLPKLTVNGLKKEGGSEKMYLYLSRSVPSCYSLESPVAKVEINSENYKGLTALCKGNFFKVEDYKSNFGSSYSTVDKEVSKLRWVI